jgi:hypothetical protein
MAAVRGFDGFSAQPILNGRLGVLRNIVLF